MPISRRVLVVILPLLLAVTMILAWPWPHKAQAEIWKWRQSDWSGGSGQASFGGYALGDPTKYSTSNNLDTKSSPGFAKLSYRYEPFAKAAANPVIPLGGAGSWDEQAAIATSFRVLGTGYEAFYEGWDAGLISRIGRATSTNGTNWTKTAENPVIGSGTWNPNGAELGPIIMENDTYKMLFIGHGATAASTGFGYAESSDGVHWSLSPLNPVLTAGTAGSWDERLDEIVALIHDGSQYKMWYEGYTSGGGPTRLGYATSPDGLTWTKDAANPLLGPGGPGSWDQNDTTWFRMAKTSTGYLLAYTGYDAHPQIGIATSPDGIAWTKAAGNPVIHFGPAGSFYQTAVSVMDLEYDGSIYKMMLWGANAADAIQLGQAYSAVGLTWTVPGAPLNPVLSNGAPGTWDAQGVMARAPLEAGSALRLLYMGFEAGPLALQQTGAAAAAHNYLAGGSLYSSVFTSGGTTTWGEVNWTESKPAGTNVTVSVRTGDTATPDGTWSGWTAVANGGTVPGGPTSYIQYRLVLTSGTSTVTPEVSDITIDFQAVPDTWYFAEGYTGTDFDEWLTLENPGAVDSHVHVTYYTPTGAPTVKAHNVPAHSRYTIYVNEDLGQNLANSVKIESEHPLICERPMYFDYHGIGNYNWTGGHDVMGALQADRNWYFAEGATLPGFDEYLLVQNPNAEEATLQVTYYVNGGSPIHRRHVVPANSRYTIYVNLDAGQNIEVSSEVRSDNVPVICERSLYFDYAGISGRSWTGGHDIVGANSLGRLFYFAEGYIAPNFDQWLTLVNPGPVAANVALTYYRNGGPIAVTHHTVPGESRYTVFCNYDLGDTDPTEISLKLESNQNILAERPMYFNYQGMGHHSWTGGHDVMGSDGIANDWYFAEGYTGTDFENWLTIENPNPADAHLQITYYTRDAGALPVRNHTVPANSRYTIYVNQDAGTNLEVSTFVHSTDQPVLCERPMYFDYHGLGDYDWGGGHDVVGFSP